MGTRRKVCLWEQTQRNEFHVYPPGWKPSHGDLVFTKQSQMLDFARASRLILKEKMRRERVGW